MPRQPWLAENTTGEVRLEFEAVLLDVSRRGQAQLWVHALTRACAGREGCRLEGCQEGRRGRSIGGPEDQRVETTIRVEDRVLEDLAGLERAHLRVEEDATDFRDNVGITVVMPGEGLSEEEQDVQHPTCSTFLIFGVLMGCLLIVSSVMMCLLAHRLHTTVALYRQEKSNSMLRQQKTRYGLEPGNLPCLLSLLLHGLIVT